MKNFALVLCAGLCVTPVLAQAQAPHWTILEQQCWKLSPTAGQCAVGLRGKFASRPECIAANGGQLQQNSVEQGRQVGKRCELLLE